jgi:hypothetical protein
MRVERLPPGVQNQDDAERGVPAALGKGLQGLGGDPQQQVVEDLGVAAREAKQGVWKGEHKMEILDRQQLQLPGLHPGLALTPATFWTVAIATRVVADFGVAALITHIHVRPQGGRATALDRRHGLVLERGERMGSAVVGAVFPKDIGHFIAWVRIRRGKFPGDLGTQCDGACHRGLLRSCSDTAETASAMNQSAMTRSLVPSILSSVLVCFSFNATPFTARCSIADLVQREPQPPPKVLRAKRAALWVVGCRLLLAVFHPIDCNV